MQSEDDLRTTKAAAAFLHISLSTLERGHREKPELWPVATRVGASLRWQLKHLVHGC